MAEESGVGHDGVLLSVAQTCKTFRYAKFTSELERRDALTPGSGPAEIAFKHVGKSRHDLDHRHVAGELLHVPREVEDEEARDPVRLVDRGKDHHGDLVEFVKPVLKGDQTLRQQVELSPWGQTKAILASTTCCVP